MEGFIRIDTVRVYNVDYKEYLGPDWKPEWEGASTIVSNHSTWLDGIFATYQYCCRMTIQAKVVNKYPFATRIANTMGAIAIQRVGNDSKE